MMTAALTLRYTLLVAISLFTMYSPMQTAAVGMLPVSPFGEGRHDDLYFYSANYDDLVRLSSERADFIKAQLDNETACTSTTSGIECASQNQHPHRSDILQRLKSARTKMAAVFDSASGRSVDFWYRDEEIAAAEYIWTQVAAANYLLLNRGPYPREDARWMAPNTELWKKLANDDVSDWTSTTQDLLELCWSQLETLRTTVLPLLKSEADAHAQRTGWWPSARRLFGRRRQYEALTNVPTNEKTAISEGVPVWAISQNAAEARSLKKSMKKRFRSIVSSLKWVVRVHRLSMSRFQDAESRMLFALTTTAQSLQMVTDAQKALAVIQESVDNNTKFPTIERR